MKKILFLACFGLILSLSSCAPKWLVFSTSGIASYNRNTGTFEILWENKNGTIEIVHDTIYIDSVSVDSLR